MKTLILIAIVSIAVNSYAQTSKQIRVNLCDSAHKVYDGTLTEYNDSNDDAIEGRDAIKMNNFKWNFALLRGSTNLIIERRKTVDTIFFNIWGIMALSYSLEINSIGLPQGILEDKYLNTVTPFVDGLMYYLFKVNADKDSYRPDRFRIIFSTPSSANNIVETKVTVFPNPSTKWVNYKIEGNSGSYRVSFYNDLGVLVYAKKAIVTDSDFSQRIYLKGSSKFYTIKVVSPDSVITSTKVVIQ